ncbi:MAG: glycosyltransferase [Bacteroidetes bacterium]|nr:glycosyltransferase [Bacteroidota bacterium]
MTELKIQKDYKPRTRVSIIIPARNEEKSIGILIKNILAQIYPPELTEIIVIDDHSTDNTSKVVGTFPKVTLITLADFTKGTVLNAYKKKAIEIGIKQSSGELIITTDADCAMCEFWLLSIVYAYEHNHNKLLAAPVAFFNKKNWFQIFQSIDFFTMQGCNGRSLLF